MNKIHIKLLAILTALLLPGMASADSLFVDIPIGTFLVNPDSNNFRELIQFNLPDELDSMDIVFAELTMPINCIIPDSSAFTLQCSPMNITWDIDEINWHTFGDTLSDTLVGEGTFFITPIQGNQIAYFDITAIVRSWMEGSIVNNGLILFTTDNSLKLSYTEGENITTVKIIYERY